MSNESKRLHTSVGRQSVLVGDGERSSRAELAGSGRLAELFRAEHLRVLRYVRRRIRDEDQARDIVQEAFVRLAATPKLSEICSPLAYLKRTIVNLLTDHGVRRSRRGAHLWIDADESLLPPVAPDQEWGLAADQLRARYEAALATMPFHARRVFVLHRVEELPYKAIAVRLNVAVSTVEYHMARALVYLDDALRDD